jgi:hypothetical protein
MGDRHIMNGKDLKVGDTVYYFDGSLQPEKVKVTKIVDTQFEGFDTVAISKKHACTCEDVATCDFYLYKTPDEVRDAVARHVSILRNWKCEDEKDPCKGDDDETK